MKTTQTYNGRIQTSSNGMLDFNNPTVDQIHFRDICMGLGNQTHFNGQLGFFSIAQHTYEMVELAKANKVARELIQAIILHDASEAYTGDMNKPLKEILRQGDCLFGKIETNITNVIFDKFNVDIGYMPTVKTYDNSIIEMEAMLFDGNNVFGKIFTPSESVITMESLFHKYFHTIYLE